MLVGNVVEVCRMTNFEVKLWRAERKCESLDRNGRVENLWTGKVWKGKTLGDKFEVCVDENLCELKVGIEEEGAKI